MAANIVFVIAGLVAMGVVLVITLRIVREAGAPLEEYSSIEDYSPSFVDFGGDGAVPAAPELPAADAVANSMYGGSAEIFENPAAEMPPPPLPADEPPASEMPSPEMPAPTMPEPEAVAEVEPEVTSEPEMVEEDSVEDEIQQEDVEESAEEPAAEPKPALPPGVPPVPKEGLPEGWTMEQWAYYGQKWLDQNKGE